MKRLQVLKVNRQYLFFGAVLLILVGMLAGVWGMDYLDEQELAALPNQTRQAPKGEVSLVIRINEQMLEVYDNEKLHKKYRIAVGKSDTPTPIGEWNVVWKDYNWGDGFGTRWMGLNVTWGLYGIHGTNNPWSIGRYSSHGCIRMRNRDVEELFEWTPIGTKVTIVGRKVRVQRRLQYQMSGADVVVLQMKLKEMGFLEGRADGLFGTSTEAAVRAYQVTQGLEPTGVADKRMAEQLGI
ncbi:MAG: L,D-transpeptidase family protein [Negativicutes bacterium]|nr:L,D-transpeptidase family protein [Negativicutes bacterium]